MPIRFSNRTYTFSRDQIILICILITGFLIRLYFASLDQYLHNWDEKFHALVAKNLMSEPFKPMLFTKHYKEFNPNGWSENIIWLHKQPLFLWQISASFKIFGPSFFSLRLPSVIMGTLTIVITHRISSLIFNNSLVSIISAIVVCFSNYQLELISGQKGMDHNDIAFTFYTIASIWCYFEYLKSKSLKWVILIGLFSGFAVLTKWLVGILVYSSWGVVSVLNLYKSGSFKSLFDLIVSFIIALIVFLPWQIYIITTFPPQAHFEYAYNTKHIFDVVEGHAGDYLFYLRLADEYLGRYMFLFLFLAPIYIYRFKKSLNFQLIMVQLFYISIVLSFFSIIVKTKMPSYINIIYPLLAILISVGISELLMRFKSYILRLGIVFLTIIVSLNPNKVVVSRENNKERENLIHNTRIYQNLSFYLNPNIEMVIGVNSFQNIDVMFFNSKIIAYHWYPNKNELQILKEKKIWIACFKNHDSYCLPDYYTNYPYLQYLDLELQGE